MSRRNTNNTTINKTNNMSNIDENINVSDENPNISDEEINVENNTSITDKTNPEEIHNEEKPIRKSVTLDDSEEIEVVSLIPNVSYLDKRTGDMYGWKETGTSEYMTVEILKDMWRNNKGYFKNLWLKPLDERVLIKFGLVKTFENYELLMQEESYTKDNINKVIAVINNAPMGMKFAVVDKIKQLVSDGTISNIGIIRLLGRKLDVDFIAYT